MNKILYAAYSDGTHIHYKYDGSQTFCAQKHPKKLSPAIKFLIASGWLVAFTLAFVYFADLALRSNNL